MNQFIRACSIALAIVNVSLFLFWLSLVRLDFLTTQELAIQYRSDVLSLEITALGVIVAIFGILLVVVGFFGWQFVVERAEIRGIR